MDHAGARVEFPFGAEDATFPALFHAPKWRAKGDPGCLRRIKALPQLEAQEGQLLIGDGQAHLHGVRGVKPSDLAAAAHELPHVNVFLANDAVEGGPEHGALQISLGPGHRALPSAQPRLGHAQSPFRAFQGRATDQALIQERLHPIVFKARIGQLRGGLVPGSFRAFQGEPRVRVVEAKQGCPGLEGAAGHHGFAHPLDAAIDFHHQGTFRAGHDRALAANLEALGGRRHGGHAHRRRDGLRGLRR